MIRPGFRVVIEAGAGLRARIPDPDYETAGAEIGKAADVSAADVVLGFRRPEASDLRTCHRGVLLLAMMNPRGNEAEIASMAQAGPSAFAMELMPPASTTRCSARMEQ